MEYKKCSVCKEYKSFDGYNNKSQSKDGKCSFCRDCQQEKRKKYYEENTDLIKCRDRQRNKDPRRKEMKKQTNERYRDKYIIHLWKKAGIKYNDFDELFNTYEEATHCYLCENIFQKGKCKFKKCLDHDHLSGCPRFICCQRCNTKLLSIDNKRKDVLLELHRYFNTI